MQPTSFQSALDAICRKDPRYAADAYSFLVEALDYTVKEVAKAEAGSPRHVTGQELACGIKDYALGEFGPMAYTVLTEWGVTRTDDFGEMVYNLIESGRLGKTPDDKKSDFNGVYDFETAFLRPFRSQCLPDRPQNDAPGPNRRGTGRATSTS